MANLPSQVSFNPDFANAHASKEDTDEGLIESFANGSCRSKSGREIEVPSRKCRSSFIPQLFRIGTVDDVVRNSGPGLVGVGIELTGRQMLLKGK